MRESWTDERLDDLNGQVSDGFRQVDERFERVEGEIKDLRSEMNGRFNRVDERFERMAAREDEQYARVNDRLDSIQRMIAFGAITLSTSFVAGFLVLAVRL